MLAQAVLKDCLFELPLIARSKKLTDVVPYRRVATAIDGDPREPVSRADIFAVGDKEYLVPDESRYAGGKLTASIIRLDQAQRILNRPAGSRQIRDMQLSGDVPASVQAVLAKAVEEFNPTGNGYAVNIVRPQP